ncbi:MAG: hypothetical protein AB1898_30645 [Acidobacteriota bacterium]
MPKQPDAGDGNVYGVVADPFILDGESAEKVHADYQALADEAYFDEIFAVTSAELLKERIEGESAMKHPRRKHQTELERISSAESLAKKVVDGLPEELVEKLGYGQLVSDLQAEIILTGEPSEELANSIREQILRRFQGEGSR